MKQFMWKSMMVTLGVLLSVNANASTEGATIDGIKYMIVTDSKTAEVKYSYYTGDIIIPPTIVYEGVICDVTSIGNNAFQRCGNLTSVTIPNSVTSIGDNAFYVCSRLTSVTIPNSVTSIGNNAFYDCSRLTSVTIPNSVTSIGNSAFEGCSRLTSITIPNNVTSIGNSAFEGCSRLTSVTIPNRVTSIYNQTFSGCSGLTSVTIPSSVTSIGNLAFEGCSRLTSVTIPNSVTSIDNNAFHGCGGLSSIIVDKDNPIYDSRDKCNALIETATNTLLLGCSKTIIPNSVTSIGSNAFHNCGGLTSIEIPHNVTSIGDAAFSGCSSLTSLTIPNSITSIGSGTFSGCSSLTSVTIPNSVTSIDNAAFSGCNSLIFATIPNSVTHIAANVFYGCSGLISVTIPNSVTTIGVTAFGGCSSLTSVSIPNSVTSIISGAFSGCSSLTSVSIPNSVTYIEYGTFDGCSTLGSVVIPCNVTDIEDNAFRNCSELTDVYCYASEPPSVNSNAFKNSSISTCVLHVPDASLDTYCETAIWKEFGEIVGLDEEDDITEVKIAEGIDSYKNNRERIYETLTYTRTFKNTGWQALYVPFSMTLSDWEENFEVARISTIFLEDLDGNGETSREEQKLLIVKIGEAQRGLRLRPNYPYLIKAKRASTTPQTITLHNATLYRTEENAVDCSTLENKFTFTGIYHQKSGLNIPGLYYMGSGRLAYTSSATTKLNPFRWYMQMTERDGSLLPEEALPGEIKLMVVDEDGAITSIEDMDGFSEKDALDREGWWTLSGVQLSGKPAAKGIYIHNGKKVSIQ